MNNTNDSSSPAYPSFRAWLWGPFRVEKRVGESYEVVQTADWGGSNYPRLLLKALLCCPGRQARREALLEMLWPEADFEQASANLNTATTKLRRLLRPVRGQESLLITEADATIYRLPEQRLLRVDDEAAHRAMQMAEQLGRTSAEALPLIEEAVNLFNRGMFLEGEEGSWAAGKRATRERERYRGRLWLADAYAQQHLVGQAETLLSTMIEDDPFDEDLLCRLMVVLHQHGMTHQALLLYRQASTAFRQEGMKLTEATRSLAARLEQERPVSCIESPLSGKPDEISLTSRPLVQPEETYPLFWNVPYQRNPFFTGREELLARLRTLFTKKNATVAVTQQALCGLGGIGKTQIALEYAYRYCHEYQAVLWAKADTHESLQADFLSFATLLQLPEQTAGNDVIAITAVKRWLQTSRQWLLILDNADDLSLVREFLPPGHQGHILLTTRAQTLGGLAYRLNVEEMSQEVGVLFLLRRAGLIAPDVSAEQAKESDAQLAHRLVQDMGGLPLAIDQAGAYIEEMSSSLQEYLHIYQNHRYALLQRRGGLTTDHPEAVAATWAISFERVQQSDPVAADVLRLCAFLDPDAIPEEILLAGVQQCTSSGEEVDQFRFGEAVSTLLRFSLVRRNVETRTLTIHRLVQAVFQDAMDQMQQTQWAKYMIATLAHLFPKEITVENWPQCQRLLPHVQLLAAHDEWQSLSLPEIGLLYNQAGYYLREQALYREAEAFYRKGLAIREHLFGPLHPDTSQICYNLARLYFDIGQYALSIQFHQRALAIREQTLPEKDLALALSLNSLAFTYCIQGIETEKVESLFLRALPIYEQAVGLDHPITSHCLSNLALFYASQNRFAEAEQLLLQVQAIRQKHLPVIHLDTARSLQNLAWLYIDQRKQDHYEEAKRFLEQSLYIRQLSLGPEHPQVATSLHNLAVLYEVQEKYLEAEQLYQQVLMIRRKTMGTDNPKVLLAEKHYANLLRKMERPEEAASLEFHIQEGQHLDTLPEKETS